MTAFIYRGWCCFVEWSHICRWRVWRHGPPVFRRGVQHPHRLLDHCVQYDHTTLLRRSHGAEGPPLCHCRVRCQYSMVDSSLLDLCLCYHKKINEWLNLLLWYCICVLSADTMGTHCSVVLNVMTLWLTAGRWWLQWQHNAVMQEFVCSEKNEKRIDSDIEVHFTSGCWNLCFTDQCSIRSHYQPFMTLSPFWI